MAKVRRRMGIAFIMRISSHEGIGGATPFTDGREENISPGSGRFPE
jgi:hypothetical protein